MHFKTQPPKFKTQAFLVTMQTSYDSSSQKKTLHLHQLGLQGLSLCPDHHRHHHHHQLQPQPSSCSGSCRSVMNSDFLSTVSSSSFIGDYIGVESCVDVLNGDEDHSTDDDQGVQAHTIRRHCRREQRWSATKKKEFPPPIPSLARTENLPSHMPWVLKRHYTSDGRLILTEEKVKHHEYFRAHRSNGRLTLQLVPLDGDVLGPATVEEVDGNEKNDQTESTGVYPDAEMTIKKTYDDDKEYDLMDGHDVDVDVGDDDEVEYSSKKEGIVVGGNWIKYSSSVRSGSPCMLRSVTVPAIRPVHT